jgi:hypothetical protein
VRWYGEPLPSGVALSANEDAQLVTMLSAFAATGAFKIMRSMVQDNAGMQQPLQRAEHILLAYIQQLAEGEKPDAKAARMVSVHRNRFLDLLTSASASTAGRLAGAAASAAAATAVSDEDDDDAPVRICSAPLISLSRFVHKCRTFSLPPFLL